MSWSFVQSASNKSPGNSSATISVTVSGVTAGDLIRVGTSGFGSSVTSITASDNQGGSYLPTGFKNSGTLFCAESWAVAPVSGTYIFTITANVAAFLEIAVSEHSVAPGSTISAVTGQVGSGGNNNPKTASVTFPSSGNYLLGGTFSQGTSSAWTAGTNFTNRVSTTGTYDIMMEDWANSLGGQQSSADSMHAGRRRLVVCGRHGLSGNAPGDQLIAEHHSVEPLGQHHAIADQHGAGVERWREHALAEPGQPTVRDDEGLANDPVEHDSDPGGHDRIRRGHADDLRWDRRNSSPAVTVMAATLTISPPAVGINTTTTIAATGNNASLWLSETPTTLFASTGISGTSVTGASTNVTSNRQATLSVSSGSTTGTGSIVDQSTQASATFNVYPTPPGFTLSPSQIAINTTEYGYGNRQFRFLDNLPRLHFRWSVLRPASR